MTTQSTRPSFRSPRAGRPPVYKLLLIVAALLVLTASTLRAATVTATWNANTESNLAGYKLSYGTTSGVYTTTIDVGNVTSTPVTGLTSGQTYYFAVQAYNTSGQISAYSTEVSFTVPPPPTVTTLSPVSGPVGLSVIITGTNFGTSQNASTVAFNGTTATPTSWSATSIVVLVPIGAITGNVVVTVDGMASNGVVFTVSTSTPPTITSVSPTSGAIGATVTIAGSNFGATQGTSLVKFNGTTAAPTSWSATSIVVPVPSGATTGNVTVTVGGVASNGVAFTVLPTPTITSLSPTSGAVGAPVTITGTNFGATQGTSVVKFNGTTAAPTSWSATSIVAPVPTGATTGNVVVTVGGTASNGVSFTVTPKITSLSPTSGPVGTSVTITGTTFGATQGTSTVTLNGTSATPTSWSATSVVVPVPAVATTGNVVVTVGGTASNGVSFTVTPKITSLSPTSGPVGTSVTITGTTFGATQGTSTVKFNGTTAAPTSWSATSIVVPVPAGATTGNVVVTVGGVASNGVSFTVAPKITSLAPTSGPVATAVTITGTTFGATQGTSTVTFNGTAATPTSWSATSIVAPVPAGAATGNVVVTVGGVASNGVSFTVAPKITSLAPTSGPVATAVTITGTTFGATQGASTVTFNGTAATPTSWSATSIVAPVPAGATTGNVVVTVGGVASNGVSFTVAPTITSLAPTSGPVGTSVTVTGTTFGATQGTSTVTFNGTAATPTSWSATSIVAPVPAGAATGNVVVTVGGVASNGVLFSVIPTVVSGSPTTVLPGGTITATWSGIAAPSATDWVALVATGAADTANVAWGYTTGTSSGSLSLTVPASVAPGTYELRLFARNTWQRLAVSNTITVQPTSLTAGPTSVLLGGTVTATWSGIGTPSATDWVALVPAGAADTANVVWWYTTGTSSGSMDRALPTSVPPGTYELRLFAKNTWQRLAVSNPITVQPTTVTASPTTVAPGGTLTVTWQGIGVPSATDWVTLVPVGSADDPNWVTWIYTTGRASDSTLFTVPVGLSAGAYEVRLFANNGWQRLAVSNGVTVTAPGPSLAASPVETAPGGTLTVAWQNLAAPTALDWVGLYAVDAADASYITRWYTSGRASDRILSPLPADLASGSYELRLFTNDTFTRLTTSNAFAVTAGASVSVSPVAVAAGGTLSVNWTGVAAPTATDWVALVPLNASDASYVAWSYTTGAASGSLGLVPPASVPPGTYEVRLFAQNRLTRLARSNTVTVGPTLAMGPTSVAPGGTVTVTWAGIATPTSTDWLAVVPINAPDTSYVAWVYTNGRAGDSTPFVLPPTLPAGRYDLRLFAHGTLTRLSVSNVVTVTAPGPTLAVSPVTTAAGGALTVAWQGIVAPTATDWIGVYVVGADDASYLTRGFTSGGASGSTVITLPGVVPPGPYELRLFTNNTFTRLAVSNGFSVVAGPVVHVMPATIAAAGTLTVTWEGVATPTSTDWVALVPANAPDTSFVAWCYTTGAATGSLDQSVPAGVPPGSYEVRLFAQGTWQRLAVSDVITIVP